MTIRFNPPSGWPQKGRAFNHGVVAGEGRTIHITGQVAWDGRALSSVPGMEKQIRQCFFNVEKILRGRGTLLILCL